MSGRHDEQPADSAAWCFAFRGNQMLVVEAEPFVGIPRLEQVPGATVEPGQHLGRWSGCECVAISLAEDADAPPGMAFAGLRDLFGRLADDVFALAGRAVQLVDWRRTHAYCGRCGTPTVPADGERAMRCPACGLLAFPRVAPAIIVRVTRGDEILLAHGRRFPTTVYSVLAGFVDPGESLEECVRREVREEAGI